MGLWEWSWLKQHVNCLELNNSDALFSIGCKLYHSTGDTNHSFSNNLVIIINFIDTALFKTELQCALQV